jgi:hypothetical protein
MIALVIIRRRRPTGGGLRFSELAGAVVLLGTENALRARPKDEDRPGDRGAARPISNPLLSERSAL